MESDNARMIRELREAIEAYGKAERSYGREDCREHGDALNAARAAVDEKIDAIAKALNGGAALADRLDALAVERARTDGDHPQYSESHVISIIADTVRGDVGRGSNPARWRQRSHARRHREPAEDAMSAQPYSRADRKRCRRKVGGIPFDLPRMHDGRAIVRWTLDYEGTAVAIAPPLAGDAEPVRVLGEYDFVLSERLKSAARLGTGWQNGGNGAWTRDGKQTRIERLSWRCDWKRQFRAQGYWSANDVLTPTEDLARRKAEAAKRWVSSMGSPVADILAERDRIRAIIDGPERDRVLRTSDEMEIEIRYSLADKIMSPPTHPSLFGLDDL